MIRIENVTKMFGRATAVDGVSLDIAAGDSVALWGVNGAGKTTLIRCVLGLIRFKGGISIDGLDVQRAGKQARQLIGYVPQELGFYDDLGVAQAVRFFSRLKGAHVESVNATLARVGLEDHGRKRIRELSGGMKQRLALAIALLGDPPVLVLDEVTASLDACGRREFVSVLEQMSHSGRTLLFASHRIEEVTSLATRVVTLVGGRVTSDHPAAAFAERLGGSATLAVRLESSVRAQAISLLREAGFAASLNGHGILVPVAEQRKTAPLRVLANARISIEDFEVVGDHVPSAGPIEKDTAS